MNSNSLLESLVALQIGCGDTETEFGTMPEARS